MNEVVGCNLIVCMCVQDADGVAGRRGLCACVRLLKDGERKETVRSEDGA